MNYNTLDIPEFIIDATKPPEEKWKDVIKYYTPVIPEVRSELTKLYNSRVDKIKDFVVSTLVNCLYNSIDYRDELEYFSVALGIDIHVLLAMNLFYETTSACTTICTKVNGQNMMFRTMDWSLDFLRKITFKIKTTKYQAITWLGCLGLFTCSNDDYAVAINFRKTRDVSKEEDELGFISLIMNLTRMIKLHYPVSYLVRDVFENNYKFEEAYTKLCSEQLISPTYFSICPKNSTPSVIVRSIDSYVVIISDDNYISQTNIDDDNQGKDILQSIKRKKVIKQLMSEVNFASEDDLLNKTNVYPIYNEETIYASVLIPGKYIYGKVLLKQC
jgi:hypothetical protein